MANFHIPAFILPPKQPGEKKQPKGEPVILQIEATDRQDALFQIHHGVVDATFRRAHPGKRLKVDYRKLKQSK